MSGFVPAGRKGRAAKKHEVGGEWLTIAEAAERCGVSVHSLRKRMERHGETLAGAMEYYRARSAGRKGLTQAEREQLDRLADELIGMAAPEQTKQRERLYAATKGEQIENSRPVAATAEGQPTQEDRQVEEMLGTVRAADDEQAGAAPEKKAPENTGFESQNAEFELLKIFNRAIDGLRDLHVLEVLGNEIGYMTSGLLHDLELKRWEMFGKMVNWNEIAKGR